MSCDSQWLKKPQYCFIGCKAKNTMLRVSDIKVHYVSVYTLTHDVQIFTYWESEIWTLVHLAVHVEISWLIWESTMCPVLHTPHCDLYQTTYDVVREAMVQVENNFADHKTIPHIPVVLLSMCFLERSAIATPFTSNNYSSTRMFNLLSLSLLGFFHWDFKCSLMYYLYTILSPKSRSSRKLSTLVIYWRQSTCFMVNHG